MSQQFRNERILVVDDEEAVRKNVTRILKRAGFALVMEAADGSEAVHVAHASQPHFVILDAEMPYMNGDLAAPAIRQHAPEARIIAFSGRLAAAPPWADAYLRKNAMGLLECFLEVVHSSPTDAENIEGDLATTGAAISL